MDIIEALQDKNLFGWLLKDPATWGSWFTYLKALFGIPIKDEAELKLLKSCTGLAAQPVERVKESYVIAGRRSGKSFISAVIASYLAAFYDWRPYLSPGERGWIFVIANDKAQAKIIKNYISAIFNHNQLFKRLVQKETVEGIDLRNGISISIKSCDFRTVRGYTILCVILEEIAFWRSEESANPDKEILNAIRPAMATIPESLLIGISTPYSRSGVLYETWKKYYGEAGGPLIWQAATEVMNPTIDRVTIEKALADDAEVARSEWFAEWRSDVSSFLPAEVIEACVIPERYELPRNKEFYYLGFLDPSGGRSDSFTLAIAHKEGKGEDKKIVLDILKEAKPPFKPEAVAKEFAEILKSYEAVKVWADRYGGEWVTDCFAKYGIWVRPCELSASELYLEFLPMIMQGSVQLLDSKRLISQLSGLERRVRTGGKDLITHFPGAHDDLANACAGACVMASRFVEPGIELIHIPWI